MHFGRRYSPWLPSEGKRRRDWFNCSPYLTAGPWKTASATQVTLYHRTMSAICFCMESRPQGTPPFNQYTNPHPESWHSECPSGADTTTAGIASLQHSQTGSLLCLYI